MNTKYRANQKGCCRDQ